MKLSEVCLNIVDCPHSTAPDEGSGYALVRTPNIGKGRFNLEGVHRISEAAYKKRCARITPTVNDLILAREAPAGNVAIIKENMEPLALGQRTVLIRPNPEKVCPDFLVYYLLAPQQQNELLGRATGATVAHVNIPIINNLPVSLPPLETQQKIAGILSAYDDLIENNRKQIKLLEEAAQKLYKEWFVKLNFPGHENVKIVDGIPEGWKKGILSDFGDIITGKTPSKKNINFFGNKIQFIKIPDMYKGVYTINSDEHLSKEGAESQKNKFIPAGSLIVSCIGTAGLVCIAYEKCQTNQQINSIILINPSTIYYLYFFIKSKKKYLEALGSNGATMVNVNKDKFGKIEVIIPENSIMNSFSNFVAPYFERIKSLQNQIQLLQSARDKLLPKFMNGEINVK